MSEETVKLLELGWTVLSSLATAAWIAMPVFFKYVRPRYEEWRCRRLLPSPPEASGLLRLVRLLGESQGRLVSSENEIVLRIRRDLGRIGWNVWTEALPHVDIFSRDETKQCSAIRKLSQVEGLEAIERARKIVEGIGSHPWTSEVVRRVARAALAELEERRRMSAVVGTGTANERAA